VKGRGRLVLLLALLLLVLAACGAMEPGDQPIVEVTRVVTETVELEGEVVEVTRLVTEEAVAEEVVEELPAATATPEASPTPLPQPTMGPATPAVVALEHVAEVEWPPRMRLGESDVVRLALLPAEEGYELLLEYREHRTVTATVQLQQLAGYSVVAAARLDGVGFDVAPSGEQRQDWQQGETLMWHWSISPRRTGQQRLSVNLTLYWRPESGRSLASRQVTAFSRGLDVRVLGPLGLTRDQALALGLVGLLLGAGLALPTLGNGLRVRGAAPPARRRLRVVRVGDGPALEPHTSITLDDEERSLLRALFEPYARVSLEAEYASGYSGARTFLALPLHADGRADAYTIAKLGRRSTIEREVENYERYVADTLPPLTARIQGQPVTVGERCSSAALRYTFVGAPGQPPASLRQRLLADGDPALLEQLFRTFGPAWWMQRRPYTFRAAQEYDRKLPAHYVLEPAPGAKPAVTLDGRSLPGTLSLAAGDLVGLQQVQVVESKQDGQGLVLAGVAEAGHPPLRLHWLSAEPPEGRTARVLATRAGLLQEWTAGFKRYGLPDPLAALPELLETTVHGSRATIHGDLNLENALTGPGDAVWLIDFAETREGHSLYDFAHLGAEIVAHVLSRQVTDAAGYVRLLQEGGGPLLQTLASLAGRCLFDRDQPGEYQLALTLACLGALKFGNLDERARHFLYLTAAHLYAAGYREAGATSLT
jgi:hypothetical protein